MESNDDSYEIELMKNYFSERTRKMEVIPQFDLETDRPPTIRRSKILEWLEMKYKCILIFTFMLLSALQFIYLCFKEFLNDDKLKTSFEAIVNYMISRNVSAVP